MQTSRKQTSDYQTRIIKELDHCPDSKQRDWSEFEEGLMRKYYQKKGARAIGNILERSTTSVHNKAQNMRLCERRK